ncbi:MAG: glycosyltransferase [Dermatophilus congolensis]|nr:glycosyltransferase [Dermatophilus congolensis]
MTAIPELPPVCIGIPTYKRPELLARLLLSLEPEIAGRDVMVLVADNAPGSAAPEVVRAHCPQATCIDVHERGISEARNALIRTALASDHGWRWLIMLDDDGYVEPGWLEALVDGATRFDADVAAGPVDGLLPPGASIIARNSVFAGRPRHEDGPVEMLTGAQNIALSRALLQRLSDPWFDPQLGITGGEDHHFFRGLATAGSRLVWCDSALVIEPTPPERLKAGAIIRRAFRSNRIAARSDVSMTGRAEVARGIASGLQRTARNSAAGLVRRDVDRLVKAGLSLVSLSGRASGLLPGDGPTATHGS